MRRWIIHCLAELFRVWREKRRGGKGWKERREVGQGGRRSVRFILPGTIGHKSVELAKALSKALYQTGRQREGLTLFICSRIGGRGSPINQRRECFAGWSTRSGIKSKHDKIWATLVLPSSRLNDPSLGNYFLMLLSEISNCMARSLVSVVPFWILVSEILLTRQIWKFLKIVESRIIIFPFVFPFLKIFKFYHEVSLFLICSELNFAQGNDRHFQYRIEYLLFSKSWNIFVNTSLRFFRNL